MWEKENLKSISMTRGIAVKFYGIRKAQKIHDEFARRLMSFEYFIDWLLVKQGKFQKYMHAIVDEETYIVHILMLIGHLMFLDKEVTYQTIIQNSRQNIKENIPNILNSILYAAIRRADSIGLTSTSLAKKISNKIKVFYVHQRKLERKNGVKYYSILDFVRSLSTYTEYVEGNLEFTTFLKRCFFFVDMKYDPYKFYPKKFRPFYHSYCF